MQYGAMGSKGHVFKSQYPTQRTVLAFLLQRIKEKRAPRKAYVDRE